jgi:hypothetical protein
MKLSITIGKRKKAISVGIHFDIFRNDVIRSMEHTYILGNASILDKQYVCTVPLEMNSHLS